MNPTKEKLPERIKWWLYHPKLELIYFLGGIPEQHIDTLHYRNIRTIVANLKNTIEKANAV